MSKNKKVKGQAHHLSQNAAFKGHIPKKEGMSIKLEGNAFKDVGSPHYNAHKTLEAFWDKYRQNGTTPTVGEYNDAMYDSLRNAGVSEFNAKYAVEKARKQQLKYGLSSDSPVPHVPRKTYQRK